MNGKARGSARCVAWVLLACWSEPAFSQINEDWVVFQDPLTGAECGAINAVNAALITLFDSGAVIDITEEDAVLVDLFVNEQNEVFYLGQPVGEVAFFDDGDGLPTVFWIMPAGSVAEIDPRTGEPFDSFLLPEEILDTDCDACELIEDSDLCADAPLPPVLCGAGAPGVILTSAFFMRLRRGVTGGRSNRCHPRRRTSRGSAAADHPDTSRCAR